VLRGDAAQGVLRGQPEIDHGELDRLLQELTCALDDFQGRFSFPATELKRITPDTGCGSDCRLKGTAGCFLGAASLLFGAVFLPVAIAPDNGLRRILRVIRVRLRQLAKQKA
jgi:hypothetical protein